MLTVTYFFRIVSSLTALSHWPCCIKFAYLNCAKFLEKSNANPVMRDSDWLKLNLRKLDFSDLRSNINFMQRGFHRSWCTVANV